MCSRGTGLCGSGVEGGAQRRSTQSSSGSRYALCALGVGLVALGVVMIIWTVVPLDAATNQNDTLLKPRPTDRPDEEEESKTKTSSVAFVLVGSGAAILLLSVCLGVREKKRVQRRGAQQDTAGAQFSDQGEEADSSAEPPPNYGVPSYEEAVGSGQYPIRQSNLRNSTTHLPSYEDLIAAVENEGDGTDPGPSTAPPLDPAAPPAAPPAPPQRSASRASRILRPLRVRRFRSEKLHLKEIRLNINPPAPGTVVIEPITPPPQYDGEKLPEL
ncbi:transmembrane protein 51b [Alosa pseudoharengus]|uniref:transmembrane protein 51b n=1 Tax=Alosa pseudoharengus TaxID=34774 RepID=UPI003F8A2748